MYRLIREDTGELIAYIEEPVWNRWNPSSHCYIGVKSEREAQGVAYQGIPYQLFGHESYESGNEEATAIIKEMDAGPMLQEQEEAMRDADEMMVDQELRLTMLELGITDMKGV